MKLPRAAVALRQPSFAAYLGGHALSTAGTWAQRVVLYWIAWEVTQGTAVLGLLAAADLLPAVFAAPFAGTMADRRAQRFLLSGPHGADPMINSAVRSFFMSAGSKLLPFVAARPAVPG